MKIIFLEAGPTMIAKNLLPIAKNIADIEPSTKIVFLSINILSHEDPEKEIDSINNLKELVNSKFHVLKSFHPNVIENYLSKEMPSAIVFGAYRIYDMLWTSIAKRAGIKVYNFQHGFEVDNVYYKHFIIFVKLLKSFRILVALYYLSILMSKDICIMCSQYMKYFFKGKKLFNSYFNTKSIHPDRIFIYSDYYRKFWFKKFGMDPTSAMISGPPDLMEVYKIKQKPKIKGCCYLTQTLVEDGRMSVRSFNKLINSYIEIAKKFERFIIKLHPRGNKELYNDISKLPNVEIIREFPNCDYYLTHYSSTAFVAYYISSEVVLHELENHLTPEIFINSGFMIVKNAQDIPTSFKNKSSYASEHKNFIKCFSPLPKDDPYKVVATTIVNTNNIN